MPKYAAIAAFAFFASLGLPGLSGFVAEIMTFVGAFGSEIPRFYWFPLVALLGVVITAAYYLITLQKVFLGDTPAVYKDPKHFPDVTKRELAVLIPLAVVTLYMGIVPATALDIYRGVVEGLADTLAPVIETLANTGGGS
jgi:NADH-quinone oxidoreductase subunit M